MEKIYAGIGSRETPRDILRLMEAFAGAAAKRGWTLRSGNAPGADQGFEDGCYIVDGLAEIYLPWPSFEERFLHQRVPQWKNVEVHHDPEPQAVDVMNHRFPWVGNLSGAVQKLVGRNLHQILGWDMQTPCQFVIFYAPLYAGGRGVNQVQGGTNYAIQIAHDWGIPVYNLIEKQWRDWAREQIERKD